MDSILSGVKIVDLSRFIAGPYCTQLLADMGAEVIKVEPLDGEHGRRESPFWQGESLYYLIFNRNKKSVSLNLRTPEGKEILARLVQRCDVVVENFRPGVLERIGFGYERLKALRSDIILVSISGFGQEGPYAQKPCFDFIAQAMGGLMHMTGWPDGPPTLVGTFIVDYTTAVHAALGTLGALYHRQATGEGQVVDVALFDVVTSLLRTYPLEYLLLNQEPARVGNRERFCSPANAYPARDGYVFLVATTNGQWNNLLRAMQREELIDDPRFNTPMARVQQREVIDSLVGDWIKEQSVAEVVRILEELSVPCTPVLDIPQVVRHPQFQARQMLIEVEHPRLGKVPLPGMPIKFSRTPGTIRSVPPAIGEHNQEVYGGLGYSEEEIAAFQRRGIV
ncbi:MAG: CoA transferase [Nitrospinota bacterium]|nr:MAG: CoA transferase [Nitrospinota bacterium]